MANQEFNEIDIGLAWQKMAEKKFSHSPIKKIEIMNALKKESHSNIAELKIRLKYKLYWSVGFTVLFATLLLFFRGNPDMVILLGTVIIAYVLGFIPMFIKYRKIKNEVSTSGDILESMKYNLQIIKSVLNMEKIWGIIVFSPIILVAVFAGRVIDGYSITESLQDPKILFISLGSIFVITPILVWAADKMNKIGFSNILKKLEDNIVKMETLI